MSRVIIRCKGGCCDGPADAFLETATLESVQEGAIMHVCDTEGRGTIDKYEVFDDTYVELMTLPLLGIRIILEKTGECKL